MEPSFVMHILARPNSRGHIGGWYRAAPLEPSCPAPSVSEHCPSSTLTVQFRGTACSIAQ